MKTLLVIFLFSLQSFQGMLIASENHSEKLIYADSKNSIEVYTKDNDERMLFLRERNGNETQLLEFDDSMLDTIYTIELSNKQYLYYQEHCLGGSAGNHAMNFFLLDLRTNKKYTYSYSYWPDTRKVFFFEVTRDPNINKYSDEYVFFENKIAKYEKSFVPNKIEKIFNDFYLDNSSVLNGLDNDNTEKFYELRFARQFQADSTLESDNNVIPYYKENYIGKIENYKYIIYWYFKSGVICIDKEENQIFALWVPENKYGWVDKINFISDTVIALSGSNLDKKILIINIKSSKLGLYRWARTDPE